MENDENQQERINKPNKPFNGRYTTRSRRPQFTIRPQRPIGDLRDHLNKIREQNKSGPPPDPKYNYLADPSRDNDEYQGESSSNFRGNYRGNFRRSRGNYYGSYQSRGYKGVTRSRGRGRGYGNQNQSSKNEDKTQQENDLASNFSAMKINENDRKNYNTNEHERRNFNREQNYSQSGPKNYHLDNKFYQGRGPRFNVRYPRGSRGSRRGRRNYNNVSVSNIRVEFDTATGEHKYLCEKIKPGKKETETKETVVKEDTTEEDKIEPTEKSKPDEKPVDSQENIKESSKGEDLEEVKEENKN